MQKICVRVNCMEYIHETSQLAKLYQDHASQTRKTTLATLVFELSPLA